MKRGLGLTGAEEAKVGDPSNFTVFLKFIFSNPVLTHLGLSSLDCHFLLLFFFSEKFFPSSSAYHSSKCQLMNCIHAVKAFNPCLYVNVEAMAHIYCPTN